MKLFFRCRVYVASVIAISTMLSLVLNANAASNPCASSESQLRSAQRSVQSAQSTLTRTQNDLYRAQNQVSSRQGHLEAQLRQREANRDAMITSNVAWTTACVARSMVLFRGRWLNCANVVAASVSRRARAEASVNIAVSNLQTYQTYSANYLQRMAGRVVLAQNNLTTAQTQLQTAQAQYDQCVASN
jgi:peptidoglycan hydrolase CwlO-like protein